MTEPAKFGAYLLLEHIGAGAMGTVWRARHSLDALAKRQGGDVALKRIHPELSRNPALVARMRQEAAAMGELDHPGIVPIIDVVQDGDELGLVMAWRPGRELATVIQEHPQGLGWDAAWPILDQTLDALAHAHERGVMHRDIKPANLQIGADHRVTLLDFGIARKEDAGGRQLTRVGTLMGTIEYMPPEQQAGNAVTDPRSDLYAFGMTAFELLTGRLPWGPSETDYDIMVRKMNGNIPPITALTSKHPEAATRWIDQCLQSAVSGRPESAAVLRRALAYAKPHTPTQLGAPQPVSAVVPAPPSLPPPVFQPPPTSLPPVSLPPVSIPPYGGPVGSVPPSNLPGQSVPPTEWQAPSTAPTIPIAWVGLGLAGLGVLAVVFALTRGGSPDAAPANGKAAAAKDGATAAAQVDKNNLGTPSLGNFRWIPPGTFPMGSPRDEKGATGVEPLHQVTLTRGYWMMETEVTQGQWSAITGNLPAAAYDGRRCDSWEGQNLRGPNYPIVCVTWEMVNDFIQQVSARDGRTYRLPSEAEWERAARGGVPSATWGMTSNPEELCKYANVIDRTFQKVFPGIAKTSAPCEDGYAVLSPVKTYAANGYGLYDVIGNAWEWTAEEHGPMSSAAATDPFYREGNWEIAGRGGAFSHIPTASRVGRRSAMFAYEASTFLGFRLVTDGPPPAP
jgi:serine/threonine-protein kinase